MRNSLREQITKTRKENLDKLDDKLPSNDYILEELDKLTGKRFIINYLMIHHALRNKDTNLKFVKSLPEKKDENYIYIKGKNAILYITDYKTENSHGDKEIKINNQKFIKELKDMKLNDGDYILPKKDGSKITNTTTYNDKIVKLTIDQLGQNKLTKIVIKDLLNHKNFEKLEQLGKDRGTSLEVLLKSYNLHNGN